MIQRAAQKEGTKQQLHKDFMTYSVYHFTCANLIKSGLPEDIFCLYFLTLQWNLISRLESTESISLNNI